MRPLYLEDSYLKEFDATVAKADGKFIILDNTAFYPNGGGQPNDTGVIKRGDGAEFRVVFAIKKDGNVSHEVDSEGLGEGNRGAHNRQPTGRTGEPHRFFTGNAGPQEDSRVCAQGERRGCRCH